MTKIILGSKSELKRRAVEHALQVASIDAVVECVDAESRVPNQPVGDEAFLGARYRATSARDTDPTAYVLGIESGIFWDDNDTFSSWQDRAVIVLIAPDGSITEKTSEQVHIPIEIVEKARETGYAKTVGQILADEHGCSHDDPHGFLTQGKKTRRNILTKALADLFLAELPRPGTHHVRIGSVRRHLPIREVAPGIKVALFNLLGDWQLAEEAGRELAKLIPAGVEALLMPDGKAQALLHVMGRASGLPTFVARKERKPYMGDPVVSVTLKSITTNRVQELFIGAEDVSALRGKRVAFVDDVVSTGGTLKALEALAKKIDVSHAATLAIFTEGKPREDVIALGHLPLF